MIKTPDTISLITIDYTALSKLNTNCYLQTHNDKRHMLRELIWLEMYWMYEL